MHNPDPNATADGGVSPNVRPWWTHPMVWLVIGGPAIVVVAGIATAVIAYRGADEVLVETPSARHAATQPTSNTPAIQARNHAATASAPK